MKRREFVDSYLISPYSSEADRRQKLFNSRVAWILGTGALALMTGSATYSTPETIERGPLGAATILIALGGVSVNKLLKSESRQKTDRN